MLSKNLPQIGVLWRYFGEIDRLPPGYRAEPQKGGRFLREFSKKPPNEPLEPAVHTINTVMRTRRYA